MNIQMPAQMPIMKPKHVLPEAMFNPNSGYGTFLKVVAVVGAGCGAIMAAHAFAQKADQIMVEWKEKNNQNVINF